MKKYIYKYLFLYGFLIMFSACDKTDGALYSGEANKISFLGETTNIPMAGGVISVPVGRTSTSGDLSVPIVLTATGAGYTTVFSLSGPVKFENGQGKSYAVIKYGDLSKVDPGTLAVSSRGNDIEVGLAFPFTLNIADGAASVSNAKTINISATNILEFEDKGTTDLNSEDGWAGDVLKVKIQKAKGANVYKLVSPFEANSIAFMIKSDGKTVVCPNQVITTDDTYGPVSISNVTGTVSGNVVTLKIGGYTVSAGSFGKGTEIIYLPK